MSEAPSNNDPSVEVGESTDIIQMDSGVNNGQSIMAPEGGPEDPNYIAPDESNSNNNNGEDKTKETASSSEDSNLVADVAKHQEALSSLEKDLRNKGVDFKQAIKEYKEAGNISSRTMANLVNAGYPKEVIESFIDGQRAIEERFTKAVYDTAGGEEEYFKMTQWASNNLPQSTLKAFNKALDSNDLDLISMMVAGIQSKMSTTRGTSNPTILGNSVGSTEGESRGFASKQDMIKAMSDPRYARDPAYTRSVEQKMLFTSF